MRDNMLLSQTAIPPTKRFLKGMMVQVSDNSTKETLRGIEGVLETIGLRLLYLRLPDQVTTTKVLSRDLVPLTPEIGEPCMLLIENEREDVGSVIDYIKDDDENVIVKFDSDQTVRTFKLIDLCKVKAE